LRRFERLGAEAVGLLRRTAGGAEAPALWSALAEARDLYVSLRSDAPPPQLRAEAERKVSHYINALRAEQALS
jgi:hypothetical protein